MFLWSTPPALLAIRCEGRPAINKAPATLPHIVAQCGALNSPSTKADSSAEEVMAFCPPRRQTAETTHDAPDHQTGDCSPTTQNSTVQTPPGPDLMESAGTEFPSQTSGSAGIQRRRLALATTSNEERLIPSAASHGGTRPARASGITLKL